MSDFSKVSNPQNFDEWQDYLNNLNPNIIDLGLDRIKVVAQHLDVLNFPNTKIVTVAGTNGKGSTATMLSSILNHSNISVGLYTSPHILKFNERIICNGSEVLDTELCDAYGEVLSSQKELGVHLTFFEFTTLAALYIYKKNKCQVLVLEVGLGGRLDATNILDADIVIIPSIGLDHCHILGDTIEKIAFEKAGVIKPTTRSVIVGNIEENALEVIKNSLSKDQSLFELNKDIIYQKNNNTNFLFKKPVIIDNIEIPTLPMINAPLSIMASLLLSENKEYSSINETTIKEGIKNAVLRGRFEVISNNPITIIDVAHNPPAARYLNDCLQNRIKKERYAVIGMLKDKDIRSTLSYVIGNFSKIYTSSLLGPRGAPKEEMVDVLLSLGVNKNNIMVYNSITDAYNAAKNDIPHDAELVVFGSFLTVEQVLAIKN
ncbi:MAG: bifunctional folylpolyglutamate synthase/dihydrofolate synthase [Succinivibrionaceae bacterium]